MCRKANFGVADGEPLAIPQTQYPCGFQAGCYTALSNKYCNSPPPKFQMFSGRKMDVPTGKRPFNLVSAYCMTSSV